MVSKTSVEEIKTIARKIKDKLNISYMEALNKASIEKGFSNYEAYVSAVKCTSVDSEEPLEFCCRCSHIFRKEDEILESSLSLIYKKFKLCNLCFTKENKALSKNNSDKEEISKSLLNWYQAPKMKLASRMAKALQLQRNISATQADAIVALMLGFPTWDLLILEYEKFHPPKKEVRIKRSAVRKERVQENVLNTIQKEVVVVERKIKSARRRIGNSVPESSSGTMHSRVGLLPTHCSPINETAVIVTLKPKSGFNDSTVIKDK